MNKVFVLGSLNMDYVVNTERIPELGETLLGESFMKNTGGKGANQAVACSLLGADTYMIGNVGNDADGKDLIGKLNKYKVSSKYVNKVESTSGAAFIFVCKGENQIVVISGANDSLGFKSTKKVLDIEASENDILLAQLEIPFDTVYKSVKYAKGKGMTTVLNPSPMIQFDNDIFNYLDYIVLNEIEGGFYSEHNTDVFSFFNKYSNLKVILTLGSKGTMIQKNGVPHVFKSIKVDAVDTTAAGDTFLGSFVAGLTSNIPLDENIKRANIAGAMAVMKEGAQKSIPTIDELNEFIKRSDKDESNN